MKDYVMVQVKMKRNAKMFMFVGCLCCATAVAMDATNVHDEYDVSDPIPSTSAPCVATINKTVDLRAQLERTQAVLQSTLKRLDKLSAPAKFAEDDEGAIFLGELAAIRAQLRIYQFDQKS